MLRLKEHSGSFVRKLGGWFKYHRWCEQMGLARYNKDLESLIRLPKISDQKIGRNDHCPCGSGKKYKKCCISNR